MAKYRKVIKKITQQNNNHNNVDNNNSCNMAAIMGKSAKMQSNARATRSTTTTTLEVNRKLATGSQRKSLTTRIRHDIQNWQLICFSMLATFVVLTAAAAAAAASASAAEGSRHHDGPSISQISPKSNEYLSNAVDTASFMSTARISLDSTIAGDEASSQEQRTSPQSQLNGTRQHQRVERSASPILNERFSKSSPNDVHFPEETRKEEAVAAGRYFQYDIQPTSTVGEIDAPESSESSETSERTQRVRAGKTLDPSASSASQAESSSFLANGGPRLLTSRSPSIRPTSTSTAISATATATATATAAHNGRQNASPDIQDIITGIVKLLNGNVNVHANTQGIRRPTASRINNRGPPRISEAQTLPMDYDVQKPPLGSSMRPPPYPFDRPERPFITGVPIPEQIVPYRPGFVSNRPPWHRNKPRPPITTTVGGRRPIPQYKPMPASQMSPPQDVDPPVPHQEQQPPPKPTLQSEQAVEAPNADAESGTLDSAKPTDTTYDSEISHGDDEKDTQYIDVLGQDPNGTGEPLAEDLKPPPQSAPTTTSTKKDEQKKKPSKHKAGDKKKPPTVAESTATVESSSVANIMPSTYLPMPMESAEEVNIDPSMDEVIFMTPSRTPSMQTTTEKHSESIDFTATTFTSNFGSSITTAPIRSTEAAAKDQTTSGILTTSTELKATISPTPSTSAPPSSTTTTTTAAITTESVTTSATSTTPPTNYQSRPGIVLDDPEFKPGGRPRPQQRPVQPQPSRPAPTHPHQVQPTRQHLPPGYGEIFDVTLSAIQGPGSAGGSQQTINIKPYGVYGGGGAVSPVQGDIIVSGSGEDGFVSIDGKRTYINLFGEPTDPPTTPATAAPHLHGTTNAAGGNQGGVRVGGGVTPHNRHGVSQISGTGYAVPETEVVDLTPSTQANSPKTAAGAHKPTTSSGHTRPHYRPRTTQPPVRIDTCIVGDDSTCDQAQHERCKTENGVSSCHCRPGYSRRKHREPCRKVISFFLGLRVDRIHELRIVWDKKFLDRNSEPYAQLSYETVRAIDSAMSMTPYSDEFMDAKVNNIYRGDPSLGGSGVFVNLTIKLDESVETLRPNLRTDVQKHLVGVIHRRNNNIGNSVLYVTSPEGSISALHDLDECQSHELNDCHASASCTNSWGSFRCACAVGLRDPWGDQPQRAGRECQACPDAYCNNRGSCSYNREGVQECACDSGHYGGQCEIDGEVLGVAIGASVAAVIIIVLTLVCLIMWSRRWQREQKNAMGSPVFGYMNTAPLKSAAALAQPAYQVTLEDRMRWAQIADVMAQSGNHYGAEPIGPTRPSSALFAYPNLQAMGMGTMGGLSMQSNMQMHQNANLPPVPLPRRLGLSSRSNGMRTLENSSSSEEEDRADLLGRNFHVPRPKSRSNGSIANQSGIYYDVDYEPSGNGIGSTSVDHLYGSQNLSSHSHPHSHPHSSSNHIPGPQGIPMSTYTSGRAPSSYYMK